MLYISTRNNLDTYTAHRALHEKHTPDGGYFVPFYLPSFSPEALLYFKHKPAYDNIAEILNLFFSLRLNADDLEKTLGKPSFICEDLAQNLTVTELWHTPEGNCDYIFKKIYHLMTGNLQLPVGWPRIAIEIALLFGLLGDITEREKFFDIAVPADDFASITAISYAKAMGFPAKLIICACEDNSFLWDLINKGECSTSSAPAYTELFLYKEAGGQCVTEYFAAFKMKRTYFIEEEIQQLLAKRIYPAVVSKDRAGSIISGIFSANQYLLDSGTALAYGSLQDYRAIIGINNKTVIFAKKRP